MSHKIIKILQWQGKHLVAVDTGRKYVPWCAYAQNAGGERQIRFYGGRWSWGYVPSRHPENDFPFAKALLEMITNDEQGETEFEADEGYMDEYEHVPTEPVFLAAWEKWLLQKKTGGGHDSRCDEHV